LYRYWLCPPIEGNRIIPLYTNSLTLKRQSNIFIVHRARAKLQRRFKLNDVIKNCFNPLNAKTLIIYNVTMVTLPYIQERNDKTSRNVVCFHDVSIGVYIYCIDHSIIYKFFNPSAPKQHFYRSSLERQSDILSFLTILY
jgi:hypothetical protein